MAKKQSRVVIPRGHDLTRDQLQQLERGEKTRAQMLFDAAVCLSPYVAFLAALGEYLIIPDKYGNPNPERYIVLLTIPLLFHLFFLIRTALGWKRGDQLRFWKLRHLTPRLTAVYLMLALLDYLTLKTGILMYPFIPWVNDIVNAALADQANLVKSTLFSMRLLFLGYASGAAIGLVTGIACGYNEKIRYWIRPILNVLGPIPTATWIPLIMILISSLFAGAVFIIALGVWFAVATAAMTGISNVDRSYFDAARTLGASERHLVFKIAIPHAMPNILQGMTQGMNSACVSLIIAEMMGVEAGLGWYITWAKAWASYNKMFAAIIVICIAFNLVTKLVETSKRRMLRWQEGVTG